MRICMYGFVSGKVQGVGFRQFTIKEAERLDLDGWVRNLLDGRVEVLVEGEESAVGELVDWLRRGPERAEVSGVTLEEQPLQGVVGFLIGR